MKKTFNVHSMKQFAVKWNEFKTFNIYFTLYRLQINVVLLSF